MNWKGPWDAPDWVLMVLGLVAAVFLVVFLATKNEIYFGVACAFAGYMLHLLIFERPKARRRKHSPR